MPRAAGSQQLRLDSATVIAYQHTERVGAALDFNLDVLGVGMAKRID
jgi:hypothetical protein